MLMKDYYLADEEERAAYAVMAEALTRTLMPDPAVAQDLICEAIEQSKSMNPLKGWSLNTPLDKMAMIVRYAFREGVVAGAMGNEEPPEGFEEQMMALIKDATQVN